MRILGRVAIIGLAVVGFILARVDPFTLLFFGPYMVVGVVVAIRRPGNIIGWLLIGIAFGDIATSTTGFVDAAALVRGDATVRDTLIAWIGGWGGTALFVGFLALTIVFPNGRLPVDGGRRTSIILLAMGVAVVVVTAVAPSFGVVLADGSTTIAVPNPLAVLPDLPLWSAIPADLLWLVAVVLLAVGVLRMVLRFRRATGVERLQLRWLVAAMVFVFVALLIGLSTIAILGDQVGAIVWIPVIIAYPTIPLAVGVAVMRYRLLEIDRIISRTLSYAVVTAILGAVFVGVILLLQTVLAGVIGKGGIPVAVSTLAVFALFQPVLRGVRRAVDRRFDRARYDGERTAGEFAERLRWETDMDRVTGDLRTTVAGAVVPTSLAIWLRPGRIVR